MSGLYVLIKNGYFYRPKSCGYTASLHEAGKFSYNYANDTVLADPSKISMRLVSECEEVAPICTTGMDELARKYRNDLIVVRAMIENAGASEFLDIQEEIMDFITECVS